MKRSPIDILGRKIEHFSSTLAQAAHRIEETSDSGNLNGKLRRQLSELAAACGKMKTELQAFKMNCSAVEKSDELLGGESRFRHLVDTMNEGLSIHDADNVITYINDALCRMSGFTREEVVGRRVREFLDANALKTLKIDFAKRKTGTDDPYDLYLPAAGGKKIRVLMSPRYNFDREGNYLGGFTVFMDITRLKQTETRLKRREQDLELANKELRETNISLNVLLKRTEHYKEMLEKQILCNVNEQIAPLLVKLKNSREDRKDEFELLEKYLEELTSPFAERLKHMFPGLTSTEVRIANMIRHGKSTKEIAEILHVSVRTVEVHRHRIRKKLGLTNKKVNLNTYLAPLP